MSAKRLNPEPVKDQPRIRKTEQILLSSYDREFMVTSVHIEPDFDRPAACRACEGGSFAPRDHGTGVIRGGRCPIRWRKKKP